MGEPIRRQKGMALGQGNVGYGSMDSVHSNTGYAGGGSVSKRHHRHHHVPTAGHHNMDGHIGHEKDHHHSHKTHGHHVGVHHHATGGSISGSGPSGPHQSPSKGPSDTQFGSGEPHGGSIGRW